METKTENEKLQELRKLDFNKDMYNKLSSRAQDKAAVLASGKQPVVIQKLIRTKGRHAWYQTNIGIIRKPL